MPLDEAFPALFGLMLAVMEAMVMMVIGLINLGAILIELIVGIFVSGFKLGRIQQRKSVHDAKSSIVSIVIILLVVVGSVAWFAVAPKVLNEEVSFVTTEGKEISYLGVTIHSKSGDAKERTDRDGVISIPRFGTHSITVKDPRYAEKHGIKQISDLDWL